MSTADPAQQAPPPAAFSTSYLTPEDKAITIGATNVAILVFALVCNGRGIHFVNEGGRRAGIDLGSAYNALVIAVAACFLPVLIRPIAIAFNKIGSEPNTTVAPSRAAEWLDRHFASSNTTRLSVGYLSVITILTYVSVTFLVLDSGGRPEARSASSPSP